MSKNIENTGPGIFLNECPIRGEGIREINRFLIFAAALNGDKINKSYSPYIQSQMRRLRYYKNTIDEFDKNDQKIPLGDIPGLLDSMEHLFKGSSRMSNSDKYFFKLRSMLKEDRRKSLLQIKGIDRRIVNGDKKSRSLSDRRVRYLGMGNYKCHILRIPWIKDRVISEIGSRIKEAAKEEINWRDLRRVSSSRYFARSNAFIENYFFSVSSLFINTVIEVLNNYEYDTTEISKNIQEPKSKKINISVYMEDENIVLIVPVYPGKRGLYLIKSSGFRGKKIGDEYYWYKNPPLDKKEETSSLIEYLDGIGLDTTPYSEVLTIINDRK